MANQQIQFQPGMSIPEFLSRFGTEAQCVEAVKLARWPDGFRCPRCAVAEHYVVGHGARKLFQCSGCRHQASLTAGSLMEHTKLPLTTWFLAMHLMTQAKNNVAALELKRHLGVRYKTAWLLKHKLMQVMSEREESRQLDGRVEVDDAYLGGELPGGKSGRGSENKVSFIAAVQTTETGRPLRVCLKKLEFTKEAIAEWAKTALAASARVVSDGLWCFQAVTASGATHERTVTGGGPSSVKLEQFRAVNTFLGNLKTAYSGTYHAFDFAKYAHRYLAEVQYRFNRRFDLSSILRRLLVAAVITPPRPERFLRAAERCG